MKHVWPRLFSPRRPRSEGGSLSASAPAGTAGGGGISRPTLTSAAEQAMMLGAAVPGLKNKLINTRAFSHRR